jgi:hypothetical protein
MGMAAAQARLLSITSRMSDNELRAQIINNNKMRLATESSQVSEAYVTALNEAQLMFSNYDSDNNVSYKQLTYNALTAYNPYNNQYILTNSSGSVLLSEQDATNYKNANGDVNKFLKAYGLEKTTTYFDNLAEHSTEVDGNVGIQYKTGETDDDGNELMGVIYSPDGGSASDVADYIQALYDGTLTDTYNNAEGVETKLHPGYDNAVSSEDYYNYYKLLDSYSIKQEAYLSNVVQNMKDTFNDLTGNGKTISEISSLVDSTTDPDEFTKTIFPALSDFINNASSYALSDNNYFATASQLINDNSGEYRYTTYNESSGDKLTRTEGVDDDGNPTGVVTLALYADDDTQNSLYTFTRDKDGNYSGQTASGVAINYDETNKNWSYTEVDEDGTSETTTIELDVNYFDDASNWEVKEPEINDIDNMKSIASSIISSIKRGIYNVWDPNNEKFTNKESSEYTDYEAAAKALSTQIFGKEVSSDYYAKLDDIEWAKDVLDDGKYGDEVIFANYDDDSTLKMKNNDFQKIYDAYILDNVMDTYGEPYYTWIDTSTPTSSYNENGEAKAQWYENLFTRIQSGGYKVLQDGLASSSEWIQFAFESGIVSMEQVDSDQNWQSLLYSSCSDITEQTNDVAIAKAEAEYNSAMNKIENKDKRYDLELKNIDTEHTSLQTEYESIKTALDKNIERTFKLYS